MFKQIIISELELFKIWLQNQNCGLVLVNLEALAADLELYLEELLTWSKVYNLIGTKAVAEIISLHIMDSATAILGWWLAWQKVKQALESPVPAELERAVSGQLTPKQTGLATSQTGLVTSQTGLVTMDVGSGAGFPGLILSLLVARYLIIEEHNSQVTQLNNITKSQFRLIEPNHKKASFLLHCKQKLKLPLVAVNNCKIQDLSEPADLVISRALSQPKELANLCQHVLLKNSKLICMQSQGSKCEFMDLIADLKIDLYPNIERRLLIYSLF